MTGSLGKLGRATIWRYQPQDTQVNRLGVATRYDRCPTAFFSAIALAATVIFWL